MLHHLLGSDSIVNPDEIILLGPSPSYDSMKAESRIVVGLLFTWSVLVLNDSIKIIQCIQLIYSFLTKIYQD